MGIVSDLFYILHLITFRWVIYTCEVHSHGRWNEHSPHKVQNWSSVDCFSRCTLFCKIRSLPLPATKGHLIFNGGNSKLSRREYRREWEISWADRTLPPTGMMRTSSRMLQSHLPPVVCINYYSLINTCPTGIRLKKKKRKTEGMGIGTCLIIYDIKPKLLYL